jgi:PPOX class probable F420-dependent enzyme
MNAASLGPTARLEGFLAREPVVWLSTVRPDGLPHLVPIWFTWDGEALLVFSKPHAQKVQNLRANPSAMLALGEPEDDFDVALAEARVQLIEQPATELPEAHLRKYGERMKAIGLSADEFLATYSQVLRIVPIRPLAWHGRTVPQRVPAAGLAVPNARPAQVGWLERMRRAAGQVATAWRESLPGRPAIRTGNA